MINFTALALAATVAASGAPTLKTIHAIAAGDIVSGQDVEALPCGRPLTHALRYDMQSRALRAARPLMPGQCLLGAKLNDDRVIELGRKMRAVSRVGSVLVERTVETLQMARPGSRLFVRGMDGVPFSTSYEALAR